MTTIAWIRRVAALGLVVATGAPFESGARAQATSHAGGGVPGGGVSTGLPGLGLAPVVGPGIIMSPPVPRIGIGPVMPSLTPQVPLASMPVDPLRYPPIDGRVGNYVVGNYGIGVGYGIGGYGIGGYGYPGMYGVYGGPYGGFGASIQPMPGFGNGIFYSGVNPLAGPSAGMGMGTGGPANSAAPLSGGDGLDAMRVSSGDPFVAAGVADGPPIREFRSRRAHAGRRPAARKPAHRPSRKPEAGASGAEPNRSEVQRVRDERPAAPQEKPADVAVAEGARPAARRRSMLGPPQ